MTERPPTRPRHVAHTRPPHGAIALPELSHDPNDLAGVARDAAHRHGQPAALARPGTEGEVAALLASGARVLPVGAQTSLTGGATPQGDVVLSLARFGTMDLTPDGLVRAGAGVTLDALLAFLAPHGRTYPATPTWLGATVGGVVATNAAGAATFKHGTTRDWVEGLTVVLAGGDVLELRRGDVTAGPDGTFEIHGPAGQRPVPALPYRTPDLPKCALGYFARPQQDLVDLFVGAEGTLGVVTHVLLRTVVTRDVALAFVPLRDEAAALRLAGDLRGAARETWRTQDGLGLDVAAIESLDGRCLAVLREDGLGRHLGRAGYALLIQLDLPPGENTARTDELAGALDDDPTDGPLARLVRLLVTHDALDDAQIALPGEPFGAELLKLRERVPEGVNRRVGLAGATKTAGDAIVPFDRLGEWLARLRADFAHAGLDLAVWGHLSDGNLHPNLVPRTPDDVPAATELLVRAARHAVDLGGAPLAEHGVGKSALKQGLLRDFYGESGVEAMRQVKRALDPHGQLAPGNLFAPEPDRP